MRKIDLGGILWRTRGCTWDYRFVLEPRQPMLESWFDFCGDVFSERVADEPFVRGGKLILAEGEAAPCVATAFRDREKRDAHGRHVLHYMVWFPGSDVVSEEGVARLPMDWGRQVVDQFGEEWEKAFHWEPMGPLDGTYEAEGGVDPEGIIAKRIEQQRQAEIQDEEEMEVTFDDFLFRRKTANPITEKRSQEEGILDWVKKSPFMVALVVAVIIAGLLAAIWAD